MNFFICYDITEDKRRTRLARLLEREGCKRVQKSVFFAANFERSEMLRLKTKVDKLFKPPQGQSNESDNIMDSVMYVPLENDYVAEVVWQGNTEGWCALLEKIHGKVL